MKYLNNKTTRHLEEAEMNAILETARLLETAFRKKIFHYTINGDAGNPDDVHGIMIQFDKHEVGR